MAVKIIILVITVILLTNEFYQFLDRLSKRFKKIVLLSIIGLLSILSIFDIYNDEQNASNLKKKTDAIFTKAKQINKLQNDNNLKIIESKRQIIQIDSSLKIISDTLSNQVSSINTAIIKSEKIVSENKNIISSVSKISDTIKNMTSSINLDLNKIPFNEYVLRIIINSNKKEHLLKLESKNEFFISFWQHDKNKILSSYRCRYENIDRVMYYDIDKVKPKLNMFIYNTPQDFGVIICELTKFNNNSFFDKSERLFFRINEFPPDEFSFGISLQNRNNETIYKATINKTDYRKMSVEGFIDF